MGERYLNERGMRILSALDEVSSSHNCSQAAIALAWLIQRKSVTAPIASATKIEQIKEFVRALEIKLDQDQVKKLDEASAPDF